MNTKNKMLKTAKVIAIIAKISAICFFIACGFMVVALVWHQTVGFSGQFLSRIKIISPIHNEDGLSEVQFKVALTYIFLSSAITAVILIVVERLFADIEKAKTPFIPKSPKRIKLIALLLLILFTVPNAIASIIALVNNTPSASISSSLANIFIAVIVYALALIFEYGVDLQQSDDETL